MRKILFVDYQGNCKQDGEPIGHSLKVLQEYIDLLSDSFILDLAAPMNILKNSDLSRINKSIELPFYFFIDSVKFNKYKKKFSLLINILIVILQRSYDYIWFYNVNDFVFRVIHFLPPKAKRKFICTIYCEDFPTRKRISNFSKEKDKLGLIVCSLKSGQFNIERKIYIPDYFYDPSFYGRFRNNGKEEKAVCLGTMSVEKNLEELVKVFNKINYPLEISGYFRDRERADKLREIANSNIKIEDRYLTTEEYFCKLAEAKYAVLPYDTERYNMRTSGVLQECIFVDTIPITYVSILEQNDTEGIGVAVLSELVNIDLKKINIERIKNNFRIRRENEFSKEVIRKKLIESINNIEDNL